MKEEDFPHPVNPCGLEAEGDDGITRAAGFLDTSEYRVFEIAYPFWFGRPAAPGVIDEAFSHYLDHGTIPFWVRAFLRDLVRETGEKGCSVRIIEATDPPLTVKEKARGVLLLTLILVVTAVFCYLLVNLPSF